LFQAILKGLKGRSAAHVLALVGALGVVGDEPFVEDDLHLVDGFEPSPPAFDAEVLVEHRAVEALDDAVGLRSPDLGRPVLNLLKLQEEFVRVLVRQATELAPVVGQNDVDLAP
jgi:hypothetical protein